MGEIFTFVIKDKCYRLTSEDSNEVLAYPYESLFSSQEEAGTRIPASILRKSTSGRHIGPI